MPRPTIPVGDAIETAALGRAGRASSLPVAFDPARSLGTHFGRYFGTRSSRPARSLSTLRDHGHPCTSSRSRKTRFRRGGLRRRRWDSHPGSLSEISGCYMPSFPARLVLAHLPSTSRFSSRSSSRTRSTRLLQPGRRARSANLANATTASSDSRGTLCGADRLGDRLDLTGRGAREGRRDPDVRLEVCFTVLGGWPGRVEQPYMCSKGVDDPPGLLRAEPLPLAPGLILVLRKQVPSLGEQLGGGMRRHRVTVARDPARRPRTGAAPVADRVGALGAGGRDQARLRQPTGRWPRFVTLTPRPGRKLDGLRWHGPWIGPTRDLRGAHPDRRRRSLDPPHAGEVPRRRGLRGRDGAGRAGGDRGAPARRT